MKIKILFVIILIFGFLFGDTIPNLTDINTSVEDNDLFLIYEVSADYGNRNKKLTFGNLRYQIWRTLPNNVYTQARNNAGTGWVDMFKLNASDELEFAAPFVYSGGVAVTDSTSSFGGMDKYNTSVTLADNADMSFFASTIGKGSIISDDGTVWADFSFQTDGTVLLMQSSNYTSTTDNTDGYLNIYGGGSNIVFENKLGSTTLFLIEINYHTP